jgi:hypothetical protein
MAKKKEENKNRDIDNLVIYVSDKNKKTKTVIKVRGHTGP